MAATATRLGLDPDSTPASPPSEPEAEAASAAAPAADKAGDLREMVKGIDVPVALQLESELEKVLAGFERDHEALLRKACAVPDEHLDLRDVVHCTFLGHALSRLERTRGRLHTERLASLLLEQFEKARQQMASLMGTPQ